MRASLARSLALRGGNPHDILYPKGSIILCTACARPLYRLERGIGIGDKVGHSVTAFAPVRVSDLQTLLERRDVDPGVRALLTAEVSLAGYVDRIAAPRTGQPALCPFCAQCFVQGRAVDAAEVHDRAFTWELVIIPPRGSMGPLAADAQRLWSQV